MAEKMIHEDDEKQVYETSGEGWSSQRFEWKPGHEPPPDRLSALEQRVDAAAALAEQASATAQDVAAAMKPSR